MSNRYIDTIPDLKKWVAKRAGDEQVVEPVWELLEEDRHISEWQEAVDPEEKSVVREELLRRYRRYKRLGGELGGSTTQLSKGNKDREAELQPELTAEDPVMLRTQALHAYWGKLFEAERDVRDFRRKAATRVPCSGSNARLLLHSPAAAVLGFGYFRQKQIPVVGHTSEFLSYEKSKPYERPYKARATVKITWPGGDAITSHSRESGNLTETLTFWDGEEELMITPWRFSVLRELHDVATKLCRKYPWHPADAAWFILTGQVPWAPPLTARVSGPDDILNHGTITINAAHWVPKEEVSRFYASVRADTGAASTSSARRLALFQFVAERSSGIEERMAYGLDIPRWRALQAEWNELYPADHDWHQKDLRNLRRDFAHASKALLGY